LKNHKSILKDAGDIHENHPRRHLMQFNISHLMGVVCLAAAPAVMAQSTAKTPAMPACPEKNMLYWQAFSARR
jgi:hypothetical protein